LELFSITTQSQSPSNMRQHISDDKINSKEDKDDEVIQISKQTG